jgi:catechol 2,3-dioxygenase-like lactoylglutathione lyase family enzyme
VNSPLLEELVIADDPARWEALGFAVEGAAAQVGDVRLRFDPGAGKGIVGWSLRGLEDGELDGLPTTIANGHAPHPAPSRHPNGALGIDHVVAMTPDLDRTFATLERAGLDLRRVREATAPGGQPIGQGFYRLGEALLEVVGPDGRDADHPATFWGLTVTVEDLDRCKGTLADLLGEPHDAVQPGRRIVSVRRAAGLATALAFMSS